MDLTLFLFPRVSPSIYPQLFSSPSLRHHHPRLLLHYQIHPHYSHHYHFLPARLILYFIPLCSSHSRLPKNIPFLSLDRATLIFF